MVPRIAYSTRRVATRAIYGSATRKFHGSPISRETMGKKAKELGHKASLMLQRPPPLGVFHWPRFATQVNMKVGKGLASAIDAGEKATTATKEKLGLWTPIEISFCWSLKLLPS